MKREEAKKLGLQIAKNILSLPEIEEIKGAGFFKDFTKGLKDGWSMARKGLNKAAPVAALLAPEIAPEIGAAVAVSNAIGGGKKMGRPKLKKKRRGGLSEKMKRRNALVDKIRKEKGISLIEASKFVKQHGLKY